MDGLANPQYSYDGNGNLTCVSSGSACGGAVARQVTVTSFNMAATLTQGTTTLSLTYDDQHQRLIQARTSSGVTTTTFYVNDAASGSMSERRTDPTSSVPTFTDYITVDGQIVAQRNAQYAGSPAWTNTPAGCTPSTLSTCIPPLWGSFLWGNADATKVGMNQVWNGFAWGTMGFSPQAWGNFKWQLTGNPSGAPWSGTARISWSFFTLDNLGSVAVISDSGGNVVQRLSYDAWGKPRSAAGGILSCGTVGSSTTRGFTNQEELASQCLVNLNARLYDASIGKFLAADPMVGDPLAPNAFNRYAYVLNNPLSFTDPSGLCFLGCFWKSPIFGAVLDIGLFAVGLPELEGLDVFAAGAPALSSLGVPTLLANGAFAGAASAGITGGNVLKGAAIGALSAGLNIGVAQLGVGTSIGGALGGSAVANDVGDFVAQGAVGGIVSVAQGGNFGSGFLAGGFSSLTGPLGLAPGSQFSPEGLIESATLGGVGSVLGGGKFANGAVTGAFSYAAGASYANDNDAGGDPTVELRYRQLGSIDGYDYSHTYIVVTGPDGQQFYMGAFATGNPADPASTLAGDQIGSGGGFGKLHVVWGSFNASVAGNDYLTAPVATQVVLQTTQMSMGQIEQDLIGFANKVNAANLNYGALSTNSNAFANQAVSTLGIARPTPPVRAPGYSTTLIGAGH